MSNKKPPQPPVVASTPQPGESQRLLNQIRAHHEAKLLVDPAAAEWPPQIHLTQATYQIGKLAEAVLSDSPAQIQNWALQLAASALAAAAAADREDEDEE